MFNKIIAVVLTIIMIFPLVGCDSSQITPKSFSKESQNTEKSTVVTTSTTSKINGNELKQNKYSLPEGYDIMYYRLPNHGCRYLGFEVFETYDVTQDYETDNFTPPNVTEITINGNNYTGSYRRSYTHVHGETVYYYSVESEDIGTLSINEKNEIVSLSFRNLPAEGTALSSKACEERAEVFLSQFVDISNYKVIAVLDQSASRNYKISFRKYCGEIFAWDTV